MSDLAQISQMPDQKARGDHYRQALSQAIAAGSVDALRSFVDHMMLDTVPLVISRQLIQAFAQELPKTAPDVHKPVALFALEKMQPRAVSFEESITALREALADLLEKTFSDYQKAAQVLSGIDLDSGMRTIDPTYKLNTNVRIAMLYLEDDDPVNAESYIKKASALISQCKDVAVELQYKMCYARILDSKRRFLEAAMRYYEMSCVGSRAGVSDRIDRDDLTHCLTQAITCAILAPAGPQRSRMLSTLYKDERVASLPVQPFLEKVYLERILSRAEVQSFALTLKPHQMAQLADGSTVLERSVMQHNLLSASKLYNNISIQELGNLLGVAPEKAETIAADMINDGRLAGLIDQVDSFIRFDDKAETLHQWDKQIQNSCNKLNEIIDVMAASGIKVAL